MLERIWRDKFILSNWDNKITLSYKELLEIKQEVESFWIDFPTIN
jgi:hypothetical protein